MASTKISALPAASTLTGSETIPLVQGGVTKKVTTDQFLTAANPSYTGTLTGGTGVVNLGSGQFVKDASGNVGVGTTGTTQKLRVNTAVANGGDIQLKRGGFIGFSNADDNSNSEYIYANGGALEFGTNAATKATLDASGNLGLGVTPSAWGMTGTLQLPDGSIFGFAGPSGDIVANAYYNSGYKFVKAGAATKYVQTAGSHSWFTAPSGTAGNAISFTQAMTLDTAGLKIATTGYEFDPVGARFGYYTGGAAPTTYIQSPTGGGGIEFWNAGTAVVGKFDASGNLGIGNTTPVSKLDVLASGGVNSLHLGSTANTDSGGYLNSSGSTEALLSGGANYNSYSAPNFVMTAKATVASGVGCGNGMVNFWTNTGLTAGTTFNQSVKATIDASGNLIQTVNTTAATLSTNGTLTFSIVDNSTLRVSVRGSDGTTRTATLALT